jgi:hypothetical protein
MNSYPCSNILWVKTTVFSVLQNNCSRGHTTLKSCSWSNVRTRLAQICHLFGNSTSSHIAGLQLPYLGSSPCVDVWCGVPVPAETADVTRLKLNRCVSSAVFLLKIFPTCSESALNCRSGCGSGFIHQLKNRTWKKYMFIRYYGETWQRWFLGCTRAMYS